MPRVYQDLPNRPNIIIYIEIYRQNILIWIKIQLKLDLVKFTIAIVIIFFSEKGEHTMHNIYVTRDTNFLPVAIIDGSRQGEDL